MIGFDQASPPAGSARTDDAAQARVDAWAVGGAGSSTPAWSGRGRPGDGGSRRSWSGRQNAGARVGGAAPSETGTVAHRALTLLMALASTAMIGWNLGRPALWMDESASAVATQRSWTHLFRLLHGADAPLVPYYTVLKASVIAVTSIDPGARAHPELLYRWPSALAAILAGTLLVWWLARFAPARLVLATAAMLLLTGGVSRYGQEARPYALVLLAAVASTALWTRLIQRPRVLRMLAYAGGIGAMVVLHDLSAALIAVHLVAALVATGRGERRSAFGWTLGGALLGLMLAAPLAVTAMVNGEGATLYASLTPGHLSTAFLRLFFAPGRQVLGIGPILILAAIGSVQVFRARYRFVARLALTWAAVPPLVLLPAVMLRPNLLIGRYLLFTVPAWALLAGLGVVTLAESLYRCLTFVRLPGRIAAGVGAALVLALIAGTAVAQAPTLAKVRTRSGHGEDIRPALAAANLPGSDRLPILVTSVTGSIEVAAYSPADAARMIGIQAQHTLPGIWPVEADYQLRKRVLTDDTRVVLIMRDTGAAPCLLATAFAAPAVRIGICMPDLLQRLHYHVLSVQPAGPGWSVAVLGRSPYRRRGVRSEAAAEFG